MFYDDLKLENYKNFKKKISEFFFSDCLKIENFPILLYFHNVCTSYMIKRKKKKIFLIFKQSEKKKIRDFFFEIFVVFQLQIIIEYSKWG